MERGQSSAEENRSSREQPSHQVEENTKNCTYTTPVTGPILIDSIYIDLGVLIENKDNQHCSNREYVSDVGDDIATNGTVATTHVDAIDDEGPFSRRTRSKSAMRNDDTTATYDKEAKHSQPRRRQKARKTRSLKDIYAATECSSHVNNGEGGNNGDGDAGEIPGNRLNESLAPTQEIPGQQPVATDDADEEAVQVLLSLRDA